MKYRKIINSKHLFWWFWEITLENKTKLIFISKGVKNKGEL